MVKEDYIKFIDFMSLSSWDVGTYNKKKIFNDNYPLVYFKEFTKKAEIEKVRIEDKETYKILGVRTYGKGVFINREVLGSTLKMRTYQKSKENHLFWCKVDTINGGFGIVTKEFEGGLGSTNMAFAELDITKINVNYLQMLFKVKTFNKYMDNKVTGTTNRRYIKFNDLLNEIQIPLPSLKEQEAIVKGYKNRIQEAKKQEQEANNKEEYIEEYLFDKLGIEKPKAIEKKKGLQFIRFRDMINKWDIWNLEDSKHLTKKYNIFSLKEISKELFAGGDAPKNNSSKYKTKEYNIPIYANNSTGKVYGYTNIYRTKEPCITISARGTIGHIELREENIFPIVRLICLIPKKEIIDINYLNFILKFINIANNGSTIPQLTIPMVSKIQIPLPPLEIQKEIADYITNIKEQIKSLREKAEQNRNLAITEFKNNIFE